MKQTSSLFANSYEASGHIWDVSEEKRFLVKRDEWAVVLMIAALGWVWVFLGGSLSLKVQLYLLCLESSHTF
jgi:hypothetical protein